MFYYITFLVRMAVPVYHFAHVRARLSTILLFVLITFISQQQWERCYFREHHTISGRPRCLPCFHGLSAHFLKKYLNTALSQPTIASIFNRSVCYCKTGGIFTETGYRTSSILSYMKTVSIYIPERSFILRNLSL